MNILLFKVILTPALIGVISVAGRIWGPAVSGVLVGLPLTSGPVALFLALSQGTPFAAQLAVGILVGTLSVGVFCVVYSRMAFRFPWPVALLMSWLAFFACTFALQSVPLPPVLPLFLGIAALLIVILLLMPHAPATVRGTTSPRWDIPARMLVATVFVLTLTGFATVLGPRLAGLLSPFPIYAAILAVFTQRFDGPTATAHFLRGVAMGLFAFGAFFLVLALLLVPAGIVVAFAVASALTLTIQGGSLWLLRRQHG